MPDSSILDVIARLTRVPIVLIYVRRRAAILAIVSQTSILRWVAPSLSHPTYSMHAQLLRTRWLTLLWLIAGLSPTLLHGQEAPATPSKVEFPPALREYKGRVIAPAMSYLGADWLIRASREKEERCSLMLDNLGVKKGMVCCDMGCGNGFYALQLAQMVGKDGHVYAVDIQPEMLKLLQERAYEKRIGNITPVLGSILDPYLPKGKIDLILCVDVYHEFSHPEQMLERMHNALSPDGLLVLAEFRAEDPEVPIKAEHKMTKEQVRKELEPNGFELAREFDKLPWQHLLFYKRAAEVK